MNLPPHFDQAFEEARNLHAAGRHAEAEQAYERLATPGDHRNAVLEALSDLHLSTRDPQKLVDTLAMLTEDNPDSIEYCARLASVLDSLGQTELAIAQYLGLLERQPENAMAYFEIALLYKRFKKYDDALIAYERSAQHGIDQVEEVYSNMGVLYSEMRDADNAKAMYERALEVNADYLPALFNLATHFEEAGEKHAAVELYESILAAHPKHWEALSRLVYAQKITGKDSELADRLSKAIDTARDDDQALEGLYFAQGKAFDDLAMYEDAASAYNSANALRKRRNPPYDAEATEAAFTQLIDLFDADWISKTSTGATARPIFICGMFRSGSTLIEQILAVHPLVSAGGELDFLPWLLGRELAPYPGGARDATPAQLQQLGVDYLSRLRELFPNYEHLTDKRPDNFIHLGLIKALFPAARIIHTVRNPLDTGLSVYFQQLGGNLNYSTDLANIAHYQQQHDRLMAHWNSCFGSDIFSVDYDELVGAPEPLLRRLTDYLDLDWDNSLLEFENTKGLVKTASVWQVREELHNRSSGRWKNYESLVKELN